MKYTFLGNTGLRVSELALGAMRWGTDEETNRQILNAYTEAGGNFVDTANAYGTSETMVGKALKDRRDRYVLATKYTLTTDPNDANAEGNGRKNLVRSLDASLKRLQTDYVDLYWVHVWDGFTPVEETLEALNDTVRQGKVLYIGLSDFPAWLVARADALAKLRGLTRPAAIQIEYNLAARDAEREILPMAEALGLSVLDWSPLGGGALTGKYPSEEGGSSDAADYYAVRYRSERMSHIARTLVDAAEEIGCSPSQLAIAWLRHRSPLHIPIIGASSLKNIEENLGAVNVEIPDEVANRLEEASRIELGFPLDFYRRSRVDNWYGDRLDDLDERIKPLGRRLMGFGEPRPAGGPASTTQPSSA